MTKAELIQENKELKSEVDELTDNAIIYRTTIANMKANHRLAIDILKTTLGVE